MKCINDGLEYKEQGQQLEIHAYCVMNNHFHQSVTYKNGSKNLSNFMRYAHGLFGARYNKSKERSGKVAEGRPKTPRVQNDYHAMQLHFYIEANPIRAKFRTLENLKNYIYSSFAFYAYGIRSRFTYMLTIPQWYLNLGKKPRDRQRKYRKLFYKYLAGETKTGLEMFMEKAIGDFLWIDGFLAEMKSHQASLLESSSTTNPNPSG